MIRPLAAFLRALDAARTAGTLARTVRLLARQLDNAHLLAASEGSRADRAELRVAELERALQDWREASGELAAEQPADDPLPSVLDAGEAPIPLVLTDSAREADIQRDRADALQRALQACEVELQQTRAQLRQTEAAAGAHVATIDRLEAARTTLAERHEEAERQLHQGIAKAKAENERLREQIAAAHRAAHAPARSLEERADIARRAWDESPPADPGPVEWDELPLAGQAAWCAVVRACDTSAAAEQIPGVAAARTLSRLECSICPYVARELDEEAGDKCPNCGSKLAEVEPCDACGKPARGAERTDGPAPLCGDCARKHAPAPAPARSKIAGPWHVDPKDGDLVRDIVGQSPDFVAAVMRGETADFEARAWNWNTAIHVDEYRTEEDAKNGADQALRAYGWTLQDAVTEIEPPPPTRPSERTATRTT